MKKYISIILLLVLALSMTACGSSSGTGTPVWNAPVFNTESELGDMRFLAPSNWRRVDQDDADGIYYYPSESGWSGMLYVRVQENPAQSTETAEETLGSFLKGFMGSGNVDQESMFRKEYLQIANCPGVEAEYTQTVNGIDHDVFCYIFLTDEHIYGVTALSPKELRGDFAEATKDFVEGITVEGAIATPEETEEPIIEPVVVYDFNTTDYLLLCAEVLHEYGDYLIGQNVVTTFTIKDISSNALKAGVDSDSSIFYSIVCYFDNGDRLIGLPEGEEVTVAGTVRDNIFAVSLENCTVIGLGEISDDLQATEPDQREICEQLKQAYEQAIADEAEADRAAYINECETVDYSDVERNPDNNKGKKIVVSGEVIQVSEGWFNSVTLRIRSNGDVWYVTYFRAEGESRILEGDRITAYGECTGVSSYTNLLGEQVTIPSMSMKYYN